jgi:membrane-associated protein
MVGVIDGLLAALAGLPLWVLASAVALVMALEASLLTGVVVPGDLVVLFAASTATTPTRFAVLWAAVAAGSVVGETVGYGIGRVFGERVQASRVGRWLGPQRWARAADFLQRRGARAVFAGRFLAAVHAVLPIVAGTVRMRYRRFLAACVVGALVWSALYMVIGALAGASYRTVAEQLNEASGIVVGGLIGAALFGGVVLIRQGLVRVSATRVDAGVALAMAALVGFGITIADEAGAPSPTSSPTRSGSPVRWCYWPVAAGRWRSWARPWWCRWPIICWTIRPVRPTCRCWWPSTPPRQPAGCCWRCWSGVPLPWSALPTAA